MAAKHRAIRPEVSGVGLMLRQARRYKAVSQETLSDRSGVTVKAISEIENGQRDPLASTIVRLAHGLRMSAAELWSWMDPR